MLRLFINFGAPTRPRILHRREDFPERGMPWSVCRRVVRAGIEGFPVGGEEHGHRPAATTRERLDRVHVDAIDIGPFLAIDLDVDEVAVHHFGDVRVLERLVRHDVTPVARGISHGQQDGQIASARLGKRFLTPLEPVNRVAGVLEQVGTGGVTEAVSCHAAEVTSPVAGRRSPVAGRGSPVAGRPLSVVRCPLPVGVRRGCKLHADMPETRAA